MWKRIAAALAGIVILLAAVVLWRASRLTSRQPAVEAAPAAVVDTAAAAAHLAGAIRFRTISHQQGQGTDSAAFLALHAYLADAYPRTHEALTRETVSDLSLLYTWQGSEPDLDPIVLMAHQDVVPVIPGTEAAWEHPPFGGDVADGFVWGRGSMDDKLNDISILEAVEGLVAGGFTPRHTIYLAFGHDEEIGGLHGAREIQRLLAARGVERFAFVVDEGGAVVRGMIPGIERPVALVGIAEKGYASVELTVDAEGGHSSTPPPHTAIGVLSRAITRLEDHPFPARLDGPAREMFAFTGPEMSLGGRVLFGNLWLFSPLLTRMLLATPASAAMVRTTTAATIIEGGVKDNVPPIHARAVVNHRILPGETVPSVLERDRRIIDDERVQLHALGDDGRDPSPVSDPTSPAFSLLARTVRQVLAGEDVVVAPYLVMGGTDSKYYAQVSPNVFRFSAAPMAADALERVHGTNERISVEGLATNVRFYARLIRNSDGM